MIDRQQHVRPLIFVVEDDDDAREALTLLLSLQGFAVECAEHGRQALRKMTRGSTPDLVITDLTMPVMDGWQLRQQMLRDDDLKRVPVVVLSAHDARACKDTLQAVGYLRKPVDSAELLETVRAHT